MDDILKKITDRIIKDRKPDFDSFSAKTFTLSEREKPLGVPVTAKGNFYIIAECKKASPSKGLIKEDFDAPELARSYEKGGASAISVLTEKNFFLGSPEYLTEVKKTVKIPVLRKDFIIHPQQVYEAYNMGADFILLIAACLDDKTMKDLRTLAETLGLGVLLEVHDEEEIKRALPLNPDLLGFNNRNLKTFKTTLQTSLNLKKKLPADQKVISESGIYTSEDVRMLKEAGFQGALIGESLVRSGDPEQALRALLK